jgi:hypothetical protein
VGVGTGVGVDVCIGISVEVVVGAEVKISWIVPVLDGPGYVSVGCGRRFDKNIFRNTASKRREMTPTKALDSEENRIRMGSLLNWVIISTGVYSGG